MSNNPPHRVTAAVETGNEKLNPMPRLGLNQPSEQQLPTISETVEEACSTSSQANKPKPKRGSKSLSLPEPTDPFEETPIMFSADDDSQELCKPEKPWPKGPLGVLTNLISCWHRRSPKMKAWERRRASALLELSKRQQAALADKQDTIDLLEWQLEQLQVMAGKEQDLQESESARIKGLCSQVDTANPASTAEEILASLQSPYRETASDDPYHRMQSSSTEVVLFEMAVIRARLSIRYFCNVFIKQMEISGYPVCRTLAEMEPSTTFLRKEHTALVLDSRINRAFFHSFENDSFDDTGLMTILDPEKRCASRLGEYKRMKTVNAIDAVNAKHSAYEPDFLKFCQVKTRDLWALFHLSMVFKSVEEREAFTGAFLDVAKAVWLLHRLAFSINPPVVILRVGRGMDINVQYVEPVATPDRSCSRCVSPKVEFMVMPGFRAGRKVIKSQVYQHVQCKSTKKDLEQRC
ncbi:hypothetical protein O6H91_16G025400 [Diphasiastrum complanatum]|uniref:Uncharacterized protein n=1 Tax=Diphasiastrum complanatum TaxID=34168 RepID=A0ACC2BAM4_DIPCM|nr:hypothetical protein O6H91_16G025400 [Diphasiastrum complanatum]